MTLFHYFNSTFQLHQSVTANKDSADVNSYWKVNSPLKKPCFRGQEFYNVVINWVFSLPLCQAVNVTCIQQLVNGLIMLNIHVVVAGHCVSVCVCACLCQSVTAVDSSDDHNSYWQVQPLMGGQCQRGQGNEHILYLPLSLSNFIFFFSCPCFKLCFTYISLNFMLILDNSLLQLLKISLLENFAKILGSIKISNRLSFTKNCYVIVIVHILLQYSFNILT